MGIRDKVQSKVAKAFDAALADAVKPFSFERTEGGTDYDPITGTPGTPGTTITITGRGVFGGYSVQETDGTEIKITDTKLTALQSELLDQDGNQVKPTTDDRIQRSDGRLYDVIRVGMDPALATYSIQLRNS